MQTEDICPGTRCLRTAAAGIEGFEPVGPSEVIGIISCGGCPGKKAVARALDMVKRGAEAVVFSSCMTRGIPWQYRCPHAEQIRKSVEALTGGKTKIIDWTHA